MSSVGSKGNRQTASQLHSRRRSAVRLRIAASSSVFFSRNVRNLRWRTPRLTPRRADGDLEPGSQPRAFRCAAMRLTWSATWPQGEILHHASAHRLTQRDPVRRGSFPVEQKSKGQRVGLGSVHRRRMGVRGRIDVALDQFLTWLHPRACRRKRCRHTDGTPSAAKCTTHSRSGSMAASAAASAS